MNKHTKSERVVISICGASGAIYGIKLLQIFKELNIETHLVISKAAYITIIQETGYSVKQIHELADFYYNVSDIAASIASGSFITLGMIIAPCSMQTLASIACGFEDNLINRAASVTLKESRKLILMTRETPLHSIHLKNMLKISNAGAIIAPPLPAFYNIPKSIDDIINHSVMRVIDLFGIHSDKVKRWYGIKLQNTASITT